MVQTHLEFSLKKNGSDVEFVTTILLAELILLKVVLDFLDVIFADLH